MVDPQALRGPLIVLLDAAPYLAGFILVTLTCGGVAALDLWSQFPLASKLLRRRPSRMWILADCIVGELLFSAIVLLRSSKLSSWGIVATGVIVGLSYSAMLHGLSIKLDLLGRAVTVRPLDIYDRLKRRLVRELGDENFIFIDKLVRTVTYEELDDMARTLIESHLGDDPEAERFRAEKTRYVDALANDKKLTNSARVRSLARFVLEHGGPKVVSEIVSGRRSPPSNDSGAGSQPLGGPTPA